VDALADEEGESASPEIVEGGSRRGVATPIVVVRAATTVALVFPLALALTLAFVVIVRGGGRGARGRQRTRWLLLRWMWLLLLWLQRAPSS
jgi:hypothetical protein